jgi:PAS domain S-box-containing protein
MKESPIAMLLVEDNPGDAAWIREMLADATTVQFSVTHAGRLSDALIYLGKTLFDIVLLDLTLPDGSGLDTVKQVNAASPGLPIVVMSGLGDEDLAVKALHEGAQDYLVKGQVDSNLLVRAVRYAIERKQAEEALRQAHDELEVRVRQRTEELILTNEALLDEIAERKKAEEALEKSRAGLAEAQRIAHLGNWDWDITTNELHWSDEIYRMFGLKSFIGTSYEAFLQLVHPDDRDSLQKAVSEALYGKPYNIEHRIVLPDGSIRCVHEQGEVTFGESGEPIHMLGTVQDITEKKENESRLLMSERLAALGQIASGIAHEINNPLAAIAACADGILNRIKKGQIATELFENYLGIIQEEVARCKGITTSMLSFVRKATYEKKYLDVNYVLDKTLELIGFQGRLKEVEVIKNYHGVLTVFGSEGELRQVFLALLVNALDAMDDKGTLTLNTGSIKDDTAGSSEESSVFITIRDNGPGISPELVGKVFDPFFTTKADAGGVGLGLSIVTSIIKDHNGTIEVISGQDRGTTFRIILPK